MCKGENKTYKLSKGEIKLSKGEIKLYKVSKGEIKLYKLSKEEIKLYKLSKGECTSADDGGSSVDCGAGVYTCLIARTSMSSKVTHIFMSHKYVTHVFIFSCHCTIWGVGM